MDIRKLILDGCMINVYGQAINSTIKIYKNYDDSIWLDFLFIGLMIYDIVHVKNRD